MQTVPNRATHHIFSYIFYNMKIKFLYNFVMIVFTLAIKILVQCHWCHSSAFIVNLKHVQHIKLVFLFTTLKRYLLAGHSVHWGINPPPSKTPPPFFLPSPYLKLANCPSPRPFLDNSPSILVFVNSPLPPKSQIFQWAPKILMFFILNPSYFLKVTKFLVKMSQFEFLVMTEKNVLLINFFCHEIFQIWIYFLWENCNPQKKVTPSFPQNSL